MLRDGRDESGLWKVMEGGAKCVVALLNPADSCSVWPQVDRIGGPHTLAFSYYAIHSVGCSEHSTFAGFRDALW
jgi:hypothetical protein